VEFSYGENADILMEKLVLEIIWLFKYGRKISYWKTILAS